MIGDAVAQPHRTQRRVHAVQRARRRTVQLADAADVAAESLVVGDRLDQVGHADADLVQAADAGWAGP